MPPGTGFMTFIAIIPLAFIMIPLGLIIQIIRGEI
jgi:hypothetical protein